MHYSPGKRHSLEARGVVTQSSSAEEAMTPVSWPTLYVTNGNRGTMQITSTDKDESNAREDMFWEIGD